MKMIPFLCICFLSALSSRSQQVLYLNEHVSTHVVLSEPVIFVDISTGAVAADKPLENILRLKPTASIEQGSYLGMISILCETYLLQYELRYATSNAATRKVLASSDEGTDIRLTSRSFSRAELAAVARAMLVKKEKSQRKVKENGQILSVNGITALGEYLLLDIGIKNTTNIPFQIASIDFSISSARIRKRINVQDQPITAEFQLLDNTAVTRSYRNVFVIKRQSYPDHKKLQIKIGAKDGRTVVMELPYRLLLQADAN